MARRSGLLAALLAGVALFLGGTSQTGSAADGDLQLALVGSFTAPTYVTAPPGDGTRLFVVEKAGRIRLIKNGGPPTLFLDIAALVRSSDSERGLLSMAFAPDYGASGRFYVYYTANAVAGRALGDLVIAEYTVSPNPDVANSTGRVVLAIPHSRTNHNGGQLQFGPDGYLYIGTGDGGGGGDPDGAGQRLDTLLGKLLRIDPRQAGAAAYTVPPDNPFIGQPSARPEIWAYGLRNPWRFSFDRQTSDLTIADVGQSAWEEINFQPAAGGWGRGVNFGWGCWEGRHIYEPNDDRPECNPPPAHTPPVHEYDHSSRGCSITGGYVVRDPTVPQLAGRYMYADYCRTAIWSVVLQTPDAVDDRDSGLDLGSVYSFGEDACGRVYLASGNGAVHRLQVEGATPRAACAALAPPPPPPPPPAPPPPPPPARPLPAAVQICRVPRLVGMRLPAARTRIRRANCRVGRLRYVRSPKRRGRVLSQAPRAGARRVKGTRVRLTISRGTR